MLNMDGIGRLNKQVDVYQYKDEKKDGITKQVLVKAIPNRIWARIEPLRGRQYMEVYKEKLEEVHKIINTISQRNYGRDVDQVPRYNIQNQYSGRPLYGSCKIGTHV